LDLAIDSNSSSTHALHHGAHLTAGLRENE
jgi:hypothetical protein